MPRPDIHAIAAKWIRLFRIQDRLITVSYVPNLVNPATGGVVYALLAIENEDEGRYSIFVQDPATWPKDTARQPTLKNIESAVRHECAHIRVRDFAPRNPSDADILAEERAVWAISDAFDAVNETAAPQFAAMVAQQLSRKPQTLVQVAANVRAMMATRAATRRQTKGYAMDAQAVLAAIKDQDEAAALAILEQWLTEQIGNGAGAADVALPMGAEGEGPSEDKPPMAMVDKDKIDVASMRSMRAEIAKGAAEVQTALALIRPAAKVELVRAMRADGIVLTKAAEDEITSAPTLEVAKERAKGMRAMTPTGTRRTHALPPVGDNAAGMTRAQAAEYNRLVAMGSPRAELYRAEASKDNNAKAGAK